MCPTCHKANIFLKGGNSCLEIAEKTDPLSLRGLTRREHEHARVRASRDVSTPHTATKMAKVFRSCLPYVFT